MRTDLIASRRSSTQPRNFLKGSRRALHKKVGYIDPTGKMVISPRFVHGEPFHEGLALVYTTWGMNVLGTEGWNLFRRAGYIDPTGKFVIETRLTENAESFSEGVAAFQPGVATPGNAKWGYLDKNGKWAIKPQFDFATDFSEGLAAVEVSTGKKASQKEPTYQWGYIEHSGNFVIPRSFLTPSHSGMASHACFCGTGRDIYIFVGALISKATLSLHALL